MDYSARQATAPYRVHGASDGMLGFGFVFDHGFATFAP
jgi:hypothetical protein